MLNTDTWRFGDDPEYTFQADNCEKCGVLLKDWDKTLICLECFHLEHGPDNDKDLDPERQGGFKHDFPSGL